MDNTRRWQFSELRASVETNLAVCLAEVSINKLFLTIGLLLDTDSY